MPTPDHEISGRVPLQGGQPPDGFRPIARPPILAERPEIADRGLASFFPKISGPVAPEGSTLGKEPSSRGVTAPGTPARPAPEGERIVQGPDAPDQEHGKDVPQGEGRG